MTNFNLNRRQVLAGSVAAAFAAGVTPRIAHGQDSSEAANSGFPLSFGEDGRFKIVQFNDTQDHHLTDRRTIEFMGKVLDEEKPHFALINGDVITEGPKSDYHVYQALNNVVLPMEERGIFWAVTFGNHDEDSLANGDTTVNKTAMTTFLRQYKYNLNGPDLPEVYGASNTHLLVRRNDREDAAFALWLLDSGRNAPKDNFIANQSTDEVMAYDWIRPNQIRWYEDESKATEERFGHKVPGLMYFHIPTFEHHHMWFGSQFSSDEADVARAKRLHQIEGVRHEDNYTGLFNSGIYAAAKERGDIRGIYCGHDHINTYKGNYYGIELGYGPGTGFGPYGIGDGTWTMHTLRGARVFELDQNAEDVYTGTHLLFAKDFGIDMNPKEQKLDAPLEFPDYISVPAEKPAEDAAPEMPKKKGSSSATLSSN